jgi:aminoglycoside/choline kinase family phosphotransferase
MSTPTPPDLRAAVAELLAWQQAHLNDDRFPPHDEAALRADLEAFAEGRDWDARQQGWWAHSVKVLVANALAQPQIATRAGRMGPVLLDLALLLRGPEQAYEEEFELDAAIRWWEAARKAGLPFSEGSGEDFGQLWQQFDWTGLLAHLTLLGQAGEQPLLMAHAVRVATRYAQLSPLAALLQDMQGELMDTGFTLR